MWVDLKNRDCNSTNDSQIWQKFLKIVCKYMNLGKNFEIGI